jgi:hypothetical protein
MKSLKKVNLISQYLLKIHYENLFTLARVAGRWWGMEGKKVLTATTSDVNKLIE